MMSETSGYSLTHKVVGGIILAAIIFCVWDTSDKDAKDNWCSIQKDIIEEYREEHRPLDMDQINRETDEYVRDQKLEDRGDD
jgi:hypothetical protein